MARRRRTDPDDAEEQAVRLLCHSVGVMLHSPISCGHAHGAFGFCEAKANHPPDVEKQLRAAKARAYAIWLSKDPVSERDLADMLLMIPAEWRDGVHRAAVQLRAAGDRFEWEYGSRSRRR